jgi:hypothetical protein
MRTPPLILRVRPSALVEASLLDSKMLQCMSF